MFSYVPSISEKFTHLTIKILEFRFIINKLMNLRKNIYIYIQSLEVSARNRLRKIYININKAQISEHFGFILSHLLCSKLINNLNLISWKYIHYVITAAMQ